MLPLSLLTTAEGHPIQVELKSGETLNGHLESCDTWMNLTMNQVIQTSASGDKFLSLTQVYIRGNNIKYLRVSDDVLNIVKQNTIQQQIDARANRQQRNNNSNNTNYNNNGYRRGGGGGQRGTHRGPRRDTVRPVN